MNNDNVIKLINENGVAKEYDRIPDLWHTAMNIANGLDHGALGETACQELSDMILQVWHMAHDLKSVVEGQGVAKLVEPKPDLPADMAYVIELAGHRAQMWADYAEHGVADLDCFDECDQSEQASMSDSTRDAVNAVNDWYQKVKNG